MEDDGAGKEALPLQHKANPRDGLIDFTAYSIEQLRELQHSIDPEAFPQNLKLRFGFGANVGEIFRKSRSRWT
jgi:hypothetical protein